MVDRIEEIEDFIDGDLGTFLNIHLPEIEQQLTISSKNYTNKELYFIKIIQLIIAEKDEEVTRLGYDIALRDMSIDTYKTENKHLKQRIHELETTLDSEGIR